MRALIRKTLGLPSFFKEANPFLFQLYVNFIGISAALLDSKAILLEFKAVLIIFIPYSTSPKRLLFIPTKLSSVDHYKQLFYLNISFMSRALLNAASSRSLGKYAAFF
jgi:hypothetical protein